MKRFHYLACSNVPKVSWTFVLKINYSRGTWREYSILPVMEETKYGDGIEGGTETYLRKVSRNIFFSGCQGSGIALTVSEWINREKHCVKAERKKDLLIRFKNTWMVSGQPERGRTRNIMPAYFVCTREFQVGSSSNKS